MLTALVDGTVISADAIPSNDHQLRSQNFKCRITGDTAFLIKEHPIVSKSVDKRYFTTGSAQSPVPDFFCFDSDIFEDRDGMSYIKESLEHIEAKRLIKKHCLDWYKSENGNMNASVVFEYQLPLSAELKKYAGVQKKRIIDVAVLLPCGIIEAHEVQLSPISIQLLEERTRDYESVGVNVYWYFGKAAATQENILWEYQRTGYAAPILKFTELSTDD